MPDESQTEPTQEQPPSERRPFDEVMADLNAHLEASPELRDQLRSNPIIGGIAGQIAQSLARNERQILNAEAAEAATAKALADQLTLAENDPVAFAEQFTTDTRAKIAHKELQDLASTERKNLASQLGRAFDDLPDGKMTPSQIAQLAQSLAGVPDDQIFVTYTRVRSDMIAQTRAERMLEASKADLLKAEREAWETETAAKKAKASPAPTLRSGTPAGQDTGEPDWLVDRKAWDEWYERTMLKRPARVS